MEEYLSECRSYIRFSINAYLFLSEKLLAARWIERTLLDRNGVGKSTDLGLGLQGSFDDAKNCGYDVLIGNGTAQKLELDRYKKLYADLWAKFLDKKIIVNFYGDITGVQNSPYSKSTSTLKFFAAYKTAPITIGIEAFLQTK